MCWMKLLQKQEEITREDSELKLGNSDTMYVSNSPKYNRKVSHHCGFRQKMVTGNQLKSNLSCKYKLHYILYKLYIDQ